MALNAQTQQAMQIFLMTPKIDHDEDGDRYRARFNEFLYAAAAAGIPSPYAPGDEVESIEDRIIEGRGGPLRLRLYRPRGANGPLPMTLYFHGGGFVFGVPEMSDNICRSLAQRAGTLVVSVDYRLAPAHKFPAAPEDAAAALAWLRSHAAEVNGDAARIATAGDSAGGNLAAVLAQEEARAGRELRHQVLLYPLVDSGCDTESMRRYAEGYFWTAQDQKWCWRQYLPEGGAGGDPRASLLRGSLKGLAPATVIQPEYDPLCSEGEAYAAALKAAGVPVQLKTYAGQIHGFVSALGIIDDADDALNLGADALRRAFA